MKSDHPDILKDTEQLKNSPQRFLNRELSWLAFNRRVLDEAKNPDHPLFERVRFVSIAARNMDEFYMVRVAGLKAQAKAGLSGLSIDGLSVGTQLEKIREETLDFVEDMQKTWGQLVQELGAHRIKIFSLADLNAADEKWLEKKFENEIMPVLTPIALDPAHPFPFIPNKGLSVILMLSESQYSSEEEKTSLRKRSSRRILIQIPPMLERFIRLPGKNPHYLLTEKMIIHHVTKLFPTATLKSYATFRIIRDGELEIEEEAEDLVRTFESALKRRRRGNVIHLGVHHNIDQNLLDYLSEQLGIPEHQVLPVNGLLGLGACSEIIDNEHPDLLFPPFEPRFPERIREFGGDCFAAIRNKDILVHHPYESFDVVVQFLKQAARDPQVVSIKQTLYRTGENSSIVEALIEAAESGKTVTALVELKARFDEEANIKWARNMERAGVQVVYGFLDLKTHAKVSFVVRQEGEHLRSYAHLGTGNYHPANAKVYTDLSYFTCNKEICQDTAKLFNYMTGYAIPQDLDKLSISPFNLRETLTALIEKETQNARAGKPAAIWLKCNALLDLQIIDKLYEASQAGVEIDIVVRGICTLRPGIPGFSENIRVKSIIGRFLEHARIYCFGNGHALPSRQAKVYIASADLMERNLSRRIEALVPIENQTVHKQVLDQIMMANLKDHKQSWIMDYDGSYMRLQAGPEAFCAHDYFMNNPSLSGRGNTVADAPMPPKLKFESKPKIQKQQDLKE